MHGMTNQTSTAVGQALRAIRNKKGLSQTAVAEGIGLRSDSYSHHHYISNWETGKSTPSIENLVNLAAFYEVPADQILSSAIEQAKGVIHADSNEGQDGQPS